MADTSKEAEKTDIIFQLLDLIKEMSVEEQKALLATLKKESSTKPKREHERKSFFQTVDYSTASGTYRDFIKDISYEGVFIITNNAFSIGEEISMTFLLPEHKKRVKIQGEIVRTEEQGVAVKFRTSQVQKEIVKSFIEKV